MPHLLVELLLDAAVEEERDVRVLLRLGDVRLLDALLAWNDAVFCVSPRKLLNARAEAGREVCDD